MREKLKQLKEVRAVFTAVFVKFSGKKAYKYLTSSPTSKFGDSQRSST